LCLLLLVVTIAMASNNLGTRIRFKFKASPLSTSSIANPISAEQLPAITTPTTSSSSVVGLKRKRDSDATGDRSPTRQRIDTDPSIRRSGRARKVKTDDDFVIDIEPKKLSKASSSSASSLSSTSTASLSTSKRARPAIKVTLDTTKQLASSSPSTISSKSSRSSTPAIATKKAPRKTVCACQSLRHSSIDSLTSRVLNNVCHDIGRLIGSSHRLGQARIQTLVVHFTSWHFGLRHR
jgi:hypothetical protein